MEKEKRRGTTGSLFYFVGPQNESFVSNHISVGHFSMLDGTAFPRFLLYPYVQTAVVTSTLHNPHV